MTTIETELVAELRHLKTTYESNIKQLNQELLETRQSIAPDYVPSRLKNIVLEREKYVDSLMTVEHVMTDKRGLMKTLKNQIVMAARHNIQATEGELLAVRAMTIVLFNVLESEA